MLRRQAMIGSALPAALLILALSFSGCAAVPGPPPAGPPESTADRPPPAVVPQLKNTLRWRTASEVDNFGFDIFRATAEDGPFQRLNADPVPGAGTTDEPQEYAYVDDTIEAGVEYWYYVESISMTGGRERFTPVFEAKPKYPADG